jgi:transposase
MSSTVKPVDFKKECVKKYLNRGNRTVKDICNELGIPLPTLYSWVKKVTIKEDSMSNKQGRPQDLSGREKFNLVIEYKTLPDSEKGSFLRNKGIHTAHIEAWESLIVSSFDLNSKASEHFKRQQASDLEIKTLKADIAKKDKALAETAAAIILKKKALLIWGIPEEKSV